MKTQFNFRIVLKTILFVSLLLTFSKCTGEISAIQNPEWIDKLIIKFQNEPVGNPP